jgi:xanthine dehydrogenase accessory factor
MREILNNVLEELGRGDGFALVTVIGDRGSTPRAAGAQMLVRADGSIVGTIGGGLLEATMMGQAREVIRQRRSRVTGMALSGRSVEAEEMICGGQAHVLVAYVPGGDPILSAVCGGLADAVRDRRRVWMFTVLARSDAGTQVSYCLLGETGDTVGEPPCEPAELRKLVGRIGVHSVAALDDDREVHLELVDPPTLAVICGAGHVSQALAPIAASAGFQAVVLDDRPEFASRERFSKAARVIVLPSFDDAFSEIGLDEQCYVIIVTRGHTHDYSVLEQALRSRAGYIGLMASKSKFRRVREALEEEGFSPEDIARVHSPVGLAIGAETPAELAVSIVAEMIQVRAGGSAMGRPLGGGGGA